MENSISPKSKPLELGGSVENLLHQWLYKKPAIHLSGKRKKFLANFAPWLAFLYIAVGLPFVLFSVAAKTFLLPGSFPRPEFGYVVFLSLSGTLLSIILLAASLPQLSSKSLKGWYMAYYAALVSAFAFLIAFNWIGFVFSGVLPLWLLLQIKDFFKT